MKPPICSICHKRFSDSGGIVYFKETSDDTVYNENLKKDGFVGHPANAFWFCENHILLARKYSELTKNEAFEILNNKE